MDEELLQQINAHIAAVGREVFAKKPACRVGVRSRTGGGNFKACEWVASQIVYRGGSNKEARVKSAVRDYLDGGQRIVHQGAAEPTGFVRPGRGCGPLESPAYFQTMFDKHLDLVEQRLLQRETIPAEAKVFSLFEPHTEWIQKGKQRPNVELGHRFWVATTGSDSSKIMRCRNRRRSGSKYSGGGPFAGPLTAPAPMWQH